MEILKIKEIEITGGTIPIELDEDDKDFVITIDGVEWVRTESQMHAVVLFNMMYEHITEYMQYKKI